MGNDDEIMAISELNKVLSSLEEGARLRVLRWACDRFELFSADRNDAEKLQSVAQPQPLQVTPVHDVSVTGLFDAADPKTDPDRALVIAYWLHTYQGVEDFSGREINAQLKQIGHEIKNITNAMSGLIGRRRRLAIQTAKAGKGKGARKRYKLTIEGMRKAQTMTSGIREDSAGVVSLAQE